jgi:hypothetical protein
VRDPKLESLGQISLGLNLTLETLVNCAGDSQDFQGYHEPIVVNSNIPFIPSSADHVPSSTPACWMGSRTGGSPLDAHHLDLIVWRQVLP